MLLNTCMAQKKASFEASNFMQKDAAFASPPLPDFDSLIVNIARNRDRASFVKLFEYFAPRVKSYLIKGGAREDAADELAQETMLTVWNKAANFDPARARASTWIFTIARNKRIDALRRDASHGLFSTLEIENEGPNVLKDQNATPAERLIQADETSAIANAIQTLPAEQADLIRQSFFEGKSHGEIAEEKKLPLGTVKSRLRLALNRLRKEQKVRALWT